MNPKLAIDALRKLRAPDEHTLHADYSGRGMFGRTTFAISGPDPVVIGYAIGQIDHENEHPPSLSMDQLGRGWVVY